MYLDQIRQLVILQHVDSEIQAITKFLEETPKQLTFLNEQLQELESKKTIVQTKLKGLNEQKTDSFSAMDSDSNKIKKYKNKLITADVTKESQGLIRAIDTLEKQNRTRAEEQVALMEEISLQNIANDKIMNALGELELKISELTTISGTECANKTKELKKLQTQQTNAAKKIDSPILRRYHFIRERLENPIITAIVDGGICSGCFVKISPQMFIEVQKSEQILSCPNCQRLVFWEGASTSDK